MKTPTILLAAAALGLAGCETVGPLLAPRDGPLVTSSAKAPFGSYLVDGSGRALYVLEGTRMTNAANRCTGECLRVWPPLLAAAPPLASAGIDPGRLATVPTVAGPQAAYSGWPLYYYHRDQVAGDTTGQAVVDAWGTWYLLAPSGEPIRSRPY
jgi:predicted lipoprotein with Yx(FWY)xxD motif